MGVDNNLYFWKARKLLLCLSPMMMVVVAAADNDIVAVVAADGANGEAFEYLRGRMEREKSERKIERYDNDDTSD